MGHTSGSERVFGKVAGTVGVGVRVGGIWDLRGWDLHMRGVGRGALLPCATSACAAPVAALCSCTHPATHPHLTAVYQASSRCQLQLHHTSLLDILLQLLPKGHHPTHTYTHTHARMLSTRIHAHAHAEHTACACMHTHLSTHATRLVAGAVGCVAGHDRCGAHAAGVAGVSVAGLGAVPRPAGGGLPGAAHRWVCACCIN